MAQKKAKHKYLIYALLNFYLAKSTFCLQTKCL